MSIFPLQQFEADLAETEREAYERLRPPTSIVVRFGVMKMVGEFPYAGEGKPGCGSKIVVRTHRGVELGEMLTSTCPNAGCSKSVTRQQMLQYIENSGGADYPFSTDGRALRVATVEDMREQQRIESLAPGMLRAARAHAAELALPMKIVEAEPILGGERLTFYFTSEDRVDFRDLVQRLAREYGSRIEMRQVGARDEARITADYERCGQHCCCKQFLKVLKPVSMRSAKVQKATLDPLKISGRCGRLMCCLRYEDETYETLRKRLPKMKSRVGTAEGPGIVVDTQILTQLALVQLERENKRIAVPVEELCPPDECPPPKTPTMGAPANTPPGAPPGAQRTGQERAGQRPPQGRDRPRDGDRRDQPRRDRAPQQQPRQGQQPARSDQPAADPLRGMDPARLEARLRGGGAPEQRRQPREHQVAHRERFDRGENSDAPAAPPAGDAPPGAEGDAPRRKKKRRRRKRGRGDNSGASGQAGGPPPGAPPPPAG